MSDRGRRGTASVVGLLSWFLVYIALVVWLTWPLVAEVDSALPCTNPACIFDTLYSAWVMAWESRALTSTALSVANANIFFPTRDALYYGPTGFGALPYFAPVYLATADPAIATNLMLLLSASLSALSLHWVVQRWTGLASAGLIAGASLLVHRWYLWGFVATTPHLAPVQYFPLIIWLAAAPLDSLARASLLLALIVAQCLTDPVYVAPAVIAPLAVLAIYRSAQPPWRRSGLALLGVLFVSLLCLVPFDLGYLRVRGDNASLATQTAWEGGATLTSDLTSLFWRSGWPTTIAPTVLVLIVVGAVVAIRRRRRLRSAIDRAWAHALLWTLTGAWISLRPVTLFANHRVFLPHALLAATTPLYDIIRVPERLGVAAMMGACLLGGIAFAEVVRALERRFAPRTSAALLRCALAGGTILSLYAFGPAATTPLPARFPVQALPSVPAPFLPELRLGAGPLLHLPALTKKGGFLHARANAVAMYLSTFHGRPILNGYSSFWPAGFLARMKIAEQLPEPSALAQLVNETGLDLIWIDLLPYSVEKRARWRDAERGLIPGLELRARYQGQRLFAVDKRRFRAPSGGGAAREALP